jgi:hypothetical protein
MARRKPLGPYIKGMDQVSSETSLPKNKYKVTEACRSAKNIDFDRDGNYSRRPGFTRLYSGVDFHSMYSSKASGFLFACQKNTLGVYDPYLNSFTVKAEMPSAFQTDFTELDGTTYAFNPGFNCRFPSKTSADAFTLAVPPPSVTPSFSPSDAGGLEAGVYTVAYSILNPDKEESPLFGETQITVEQGGGVLLIGVPIDSTSFIRLYASTANGEELYQVIEAPMSSTSYLVGITEVKAGGQQPETRFMEEIPPGHFVEAFNNRLMVARDNAVIWSGAFRPHLTDPRHNFILMESTITMMKPVDGGVYISDGQSVIFLSNENPDEFIPKDIDADPAIFGSATTVPGAAIGSEMDHAVIWLTSHGHIAGLPGGQIQRLNPEQLNLPGYSVASGTYVERDGIKQVIIPVNSERQNGPGTATNSSIY